VGAVNVEMLLKAVSAEAPSGVDVRYDARFLEVERVSMGKEERQVGDKKIPAEPPDWRELRDGCFELLGKTKNLRVGVWLCAAMVRTEGYAGFRDALAVLRGILEQFWPDVYPQLDPDDGNDPQERINVVAQLSTPIGSFGDTIQMLNGVREAPLCESPQVGRVTLRDIHVALGEAPPADPGGEPPPKPKDMALIDGAFLSVETGPLEATAAVIDECLEHVKGVEAAFVKWVGQGRSPDLGALKKLLAEATKNVRKRLEGRGGAAAPAADAGAGAGAGGGAGSGAVGVQSRPPGDISSRDDVLLALKKINEYYERNEPSSPVALVTQCAEKLVGKNFLEISRALDSSAVQILERLSTT
jgi:type VI secretion system protein ImpA